MKSTLSLKEASNTSWDAIVIGGGPAGGFCGYLLAKSGIKVLIVDKDNHPRFKVCGCCINGTGHELLLESGILDTLSCDTVSLTDGVIFSSRNKIQLNSLNGIAVDRALLDSAILSKAIDHGAQVLFETRGSLGKVDADHKEVILTNKEELSVAVNGKVVIGAFGNSGTMSVQLMPNSYIGIGAQYKGTILPSHIYLTVDTNGYVGAVQLQNQTVNIAAAIPVSFIKENNGIQNAVQSIVDSSNLSQTLKIPSTNWQGTRPLTFEGHISSHRYFSVGDACGYVEPFTGEGISWALESAYRVTPIILKALLRWDDTLSVQWKKLHESTIGKRHRFCRFTQRALRWPGPIRDLSIFVSKYKPARNLCEKLVRGTAPNWFN